MANLVLFFFAVIGMTHIIVDSTLFHPPREWIKKKFPGYLAKLFTCYQCAGTWCGFILGAMVVSNTNPLLIFACGCAGSFLATLAKFVLVYLEFQSVQVDLDDIEVVEKKDEEVPPVL